jgi:hypothetical protein
VPPTVGEKVGENLTRRVEHDAERYERWAVAAAALVAIALVAVGALRYGITLNTDSVGYKVTADNLAAGRGLGWWIDPHFVSWPPLLPFLLAVGERWTPLDARTVGLWLNFACLAGIVVLTHRLLVATVRRAWLRILALVIVAVAPAVLEVNRMLWTEPLFIVLVLATLLCLLRAVAADDDWRWLAAAVGLAALAFLTRYIGIVLAPAGALTLLVLPRSRTLRRRLLPALAFGAAAIVVPALWLARNRAVSGTIFDNRPGSGADTASAFTTAFGNTLRGVGQWIFWWAGGLQPALGAAAVAAVGGALVWFVVLRARHQEHQDASATREDRELERAWRLAPMVLFIVVYVATLLGSRSVVGFGLSFARFLAPLFVPVLVVAVAAVEGVADLSAPPVRRLVLTSTGVGLLAWTLVLTLTSSRFSYEHLRGGAVYASKTFQQADLAGIERDAGLDRCRVYTDDPEGLNLWTGLEPQQSPRSGAQYTGGEVDDVVAFQRAAANGDVCLVWLGFDDNRGLLDPAQLGQHVALRPVLERNHVTVYEVGPGGAA